MYRTDLKLPQFSASVKPLQEVRCSACRYAVRFRAYPEVIDCTQLHKMQNADTFRDCSAFEAA